MPRDQSEGIVLRTYPVGEQDKIVVFFSNTKGVFQGVAKGARKFGNRFGSCLEPLSHIKIFYYEKENKDLVTISHCDLMESFFEIQADVDTAYTLSYFAELIEEFIPTRSGDEILYRLLLATLKAVKAGGNLKFNAAYFEVWFLKVNGFLPNFRTCKKCQQPVGETGSLSPPKDGVYCGSCSPRATETLGSDLHAFISWIKTNPPSCDPEPKIPDDQVESIRKTFQDIIVYHLEHEPKSLRYVKIEPKGGRT